MTEGPDNEARPSSLDTTATRPLTDAIAEAEHILRSSPLCTSEQMLAEGLDYLAGSVRAIIQSRQHSDRRFPLLSESTGPFTKMGLDNPDTIYYHANLADGAEYLVEGVRGTTTDLSFQVLQGNYSASEVAGSATAFDDRDIEIAADGSFSFRMGPMRGEGAPPEPGYLGLAEGSSILSIREVFSDWDSETPGRIWLTRTDTLGEENPKSDVTPEAMGKFYERAGKALVSRMHTWLAFPEWFFGEQEPNTFGAPRLTPGGLATQYSSAGRFALAPGQAMIVSVPASDAPYQGFQLGSPWYISLEYVDRQTSLTSRQAHTTDGMIHMVLAAENPGVANWIDTMGHAEGIMQFRWQRVSAPITDDAGPTAHLVDAADIASELPDFAEQKVTPEQWSERIAARRRAFARRMRS